MNVYIDPTSPDHLGNALFKKNPGGDPSRPWRYTKEYCGRHNIIVNTIDFYGKKKPGNNDVYVSLEHTSFLRKLYWRIGRNRNYPTNINLNNFAKRILIQGEPPMADPAAYQSLRALFKIYDKIFFPFKSDGFAIGKDKVSGLRAGFYQMGFSRDEIPVCQKNPVRKFLTMINTNRSPRNLKKILLLLSLGMKFQYLGYKELLTERIRAIEFFGRTNDIDLYGYDWDKPLPFPYWFHEKRILKAYKGVVQLKLQTLCDYTFSLVFENCALPSHISEKIFDCFYAGAIPVYLGAPDIEEYIPKNCFIHTRDFKNYEALRRFLKSLAPAEIKAYRENAHSFLQSEKMNPFTLDHFAKLFVDAVI